MSNEIIIRPVKLSDAERLLEIYAPYVLSTAITYEYDVPSIEEFKARIREISNKYPYLVALDGDEIVGYAYSSPFKARKAYSWSVETSIYLDRTARRRGVGRKLYSALEAELKKRNYTNLNACIAYTDNPDKYLNNDSYLFHTAMGYTLVGRFHKCAYKFSTWYDMIWMEKIIAEHKIPQPETIPFCCSEDEER